MATHTSLQLIISNVDQQLFNGEAASVTVPSTEGEMTVLPRHEAYVTTLRKGVVVVRTSDSDEPHTFEIDGGVCEISANQMTILV